MAKGYSLDAMADVLYPSVRSPLGSVNLNTLTSRDSVGIYAQNSNAAATPANNYPIAEAGTLEVMWHAANAAGNVMQRYTSFNQNREFVRSQIDSTGAWNDWEEHVRMSQLYKFIYPVGSVIMFEISANPNAMFPGTTWVQRTTGRSVRASNNNTVGTAAGNIGALIGADSITLVTGQLPEHAHNVPAHAHTMAHTHSVPAHAHTMAHTHSTPNHTHTLSAATSIASNGAHTHPITLHNLDATGPNVPDGSGPATGAKAATDSAGAHSHTATTTISQTASGGGTTGGSSAANTGTQAAMTTGGVSTANTGTQPVTATGNAGNGSAINITNSSIYYAFWARTA